MTAHVRGAGLGLLVRPFVQLESQASCAFYSVKNVLCYQEHEGTPIDWNLGMDTNPDGYIVKTPGVCGGKPRIAGHRIRVQDIVVLHEQQGQSPDEIVSAYPQLSLAKVYAALAYYHDHREDIRRDMAEDEAFVKEFKQQHSSLIVSSSDTQTSRDSLPPR